METKLSRETKSEQLKGLPKELIRGLVYNHDRANANTAQLHETSATLQAMVELLVQGGVLDREMFEERRIEAAENLRQHYIKQGMAVAMQEFGGSKYQFQSGAEVDCENHVHLNREKHCCTIYNNRPIPCRGYDCSKDKRIWLNLKNQVVDPRIYDLDWLECLETEVSSTAVGDK